MDAYAEDWAVYVCYEHRGRRLREWVAAQWLTVTPEIPGGLNLVAQEVPNARPENPGRLPGESSRGFYGRVR